MSKPKIAIIGGGISGLTLAQELSPHAAIVIFEKSRGVGGRMATRRAGPFEFDHGTQFFTAKTTEFKAWLEALTQGGTIAEWSGQVISVQQGQEPQERPWPEPHYVAAPHMSSLAKEMAHGLTIQLATPVARLTTRQPDGWHLHDTSGNTLGVFDWVISTAPPAQTLKLFADLIPPGSALAETTMQGCYTLMLAWDAPWRQPWIAAKVRNSPIEWVAVNSSKPSRNRDLTAIVIHSSNTWAQAHLDDDLEQTKAFLMAQVPSTLQIDSKSATHAELHRWRYALRSSHQSAAPYLDLSMRIGSTGDWCIASRIEDAWLSARSLAASLRKEL